MLKKKISIIIQARLGSTRFPKKIMSKVLKKPLILILIERLKRCKEIDDIIVAIPDNKNNDPLFKFLKKNKVKIFRGSEKNTLKRYYFAAKKSKSDYIVRITSDCPLADPLLVDNHVKLFIKNKPDYLSNNLSLSFPHGFDLEIFSFNALSIAFKNARSKYEKEHVTPFIRRHKKFKKMNILLKENFYFLRLTLDYREDLKVIRKVLNHFKNKMFYLEDIIKLYKKKKTYFSYNQFLKAKENKKTQLPKSSFIEKVY